MNATYYQFMQLRLQAEGLLRQAEKLDVADHFKAQAKAAANLAGVQFSQVAGMADRADAENLADDLVAVANIIDPLVEAIGDEAYRHLPIADDDRQCFRDQLLGALEGNATYLVTEAGRELEESYREPDPDYLRDLRAETV